MPVFIFNTKFLISKIDNFIPPNTLMQYISSVINTNKLEITVTNI